MIKRGLLLLASILGVCAVFTVSSVSAQQSSLNQEILPYVCVYTSVAAGGVGTTTDTTCEEQPIPTVNYVTTEQGRQVIVGYFNTLKTKTLRVTVGTQQFTSGINSALVIHLTNNTWSLDVQAAMPQLQSGTYTISVEAETYEGILLKNNNAFTFIFEPQNEPTVLAPNNLGQAFSIYTPLSMFPVWIASQQDSSSMTPNQSMLYPVDYSQGTQTLKGTDAQIFLVITILGVALLTVGYFWRMYRK